jgi:hypothetical protein
MNKQIYAAGLCLLLVNCGFGSDGVGDRTNVLYPAEASTVVIADFTKPIALSPLEPGWDHDTFFLVDPMDISFVKHDEVDAMRLETNGSASILQRYMHVPLKQFPILRWKWLVEKGIDNDIDETTSKGDDSPARLIISFSAEEESPRRFEIIWAKQLKSGDKKFTHDFNHYVARGVDDEFGIWYEDTLDLEKLYSEFWPDNKEAVIDGISFFSDTDDTGEWTIAYYASVALVKRD